MADRALILSADKYSIPDEKTGVIQDLHQVWFATEYREDSETEMGCKPIKMLTTPEIFAELRKNGLPALFDLDLRSRPGKGNTASLMLSGVKFVSDPAVFAPTKKAA